MIELKKHFSRNNSRLPEWSHQHKWFVKVRDENEKNERSQKRAEERMLDFGADVIAATELQIREFEARLDRYDSATVSALMENQKQFDAVHARIEVMLQQAFVMEDGRRVFKTEDGTQVFDEHGQEVGHDELDYNLINSDHPTWEEMQANMEVRDDLLNEQSSILTYQDRLDATRDQIADGEITQEELEALDAELLDIMPASVQEKIPGMEPSGPLNLTSSFNLVVTTPVLAQQADPSIPSLTQ